MSVQQTQRDAGTATVAEVPGAVVKVIELVGSSGDSFSDAVRNAVRTASKTIRHIRGVDVLSSSATVGPDGGIAVYKVTCKIAFVIEDDGAGPRLGDGEVLSGDGDRA